MTTGTPTSAPGSVETVAVLGTGRMGAAMARTLSGAGFRVVVWNRTPSVANSLAAEIGASVAATPADAALEADVVVASLADDAAVEAVHLGGDGTIEGVEAGGVVMDTSTVDPETIARIAPRFTAVGAGFLDAPVSGSVSLVAQGAVTSMVGGDDAAVERAGPVLDALSGRVFHLGPSGTGAAMKLAVNALVHATNLALSEALVLAEATGIARSLAYEVMASSAAGSPFVQYKRAAYEDPEHTPVAFSLDLVAKDLDLILDLARRKGVPMEQAVTTAAVTAAAIDTGLGASDMSALAVNLRNQMKP